MAIYCQVIRAFFVFMIRSIMVKELIKKFEVNPDYHFEKLSTMNFFLSFIIVNTISLSLFFFSVQENIFFQFLYSAISFLILLFYNRPYFLLKLLEFLYKKLK